MRVFVRVSVCDVCLIIEPSSVINTGLNGSFIGRYFSARSPGSGQGNYTTVILNNCFT